MYSRAMGWPHHMLRFCHIHIQLMNPHRVFFRMNDFDGGITFEIHHNAITMIMIGVTNFFNRCFLDSLANWESTNKNGRNRQHWRLPQPQMLRLIQTINPPIADPMNRPCQNNQLHNYSLSFLKNNLGGYIFV